MRYTGEDCDATSHGQDESKVSCDGDPGFASPVHIISSDSSTPGTGHIWFDGIVELDGTFDDMFTKY